jgi:2-amino-4-hydroxy-6-hydroxymethyldihydropteridine diphosphokinase
MSLAYIALGANLLSSAGPPEATLAAAAERLAALGRVTACSSLYSTAPVGFQDQPRFANAVVALETHLSPNEVLNGLLAIEHEFGRDRAASPPNGPRTLDLDILFYGDVVLTASGLEIPHPRLAGRAFVLVPLNEIAPDLRHPRSGKTVVEMLQSLPDGAAPNAVAKIECGVWTDTTVR